MKKIPQDIIGDIAVLKFPRRTLWITKKLKARKFLKQHKNVTTVLEKTNGFSGILRTQKTKYLAGIKTKETTYIENNCRFKFNIDETYFSPRLSNERKITAEEISKLTKKKDMRILVMFAGVGPYPIILAKKLKKEKKQVEVYSNELNKKAYHYMRDNITRNKLSDYIIQVPGDAKKLPTKIKDKMDVIFMPRPNIEDTFLKTALKMSKKGATIFYHGFGTKEEVLEEVREACGEKIGKISIRKAGDIAVEKYRWFVRFKVK